MLSNMSDRVLLRPVDSGAALYTRFSLSFDGVKECNKTSKFLPYCFGETPVYFTSLLPDSSQLSTDGPRLNTDGPKAGFRGVLCSYHTPCKWVWYKIFVC